MARGGRKLVAVLAASFLAGLLLVGGLILWPSAEGPVVQSPMAPETPKAAPGAPPDNASAGGAALPAGGRETAPLLAVVVQGLGYDPSRDGDWLRVPEKISVAVLPFGPSSGQVAASAKSRGFAILLHVPMEPEGTVSDRTEPFRLRRGMPVGEMRDLFQRMVADVPGATGVSNYMGSAFLADEASVTSWIGLVRERGFFLLDTATTPRSLAIEAAKAAGVPAERRDVAVEAGASPQEMRKGWRQAVSSAREQGKAILLWPARDGALQALLDLLPEARKEGVSLVTLDALIAAAGRKM